MFKQMVKRAAEAAVPSLTTTFRDLRDQRFAVSSRLIPTNFGFALAGSPLQASGSFEDAEIRVFMAHLEHVDVCIDVGANIGLYSCIARSKEKQTVSVEPVTANLALLYRNLLSNGFEAEVFPVGLGSRPELKTIYGGGTGASFVERWANTPTSWKHVVPVTTLDAIAGLRFNGKRLLVKIDVEGFEYSVLQGATVTLNLNPRPVWLMEICLDEHFPGRINPNFAQTFETFWNAGYQASVADDSCRQVTPADVARWLASGHVDFGTHNYIFSAVSVPTA